MATLNLQKYRNRTSEFHSACERLRGGVVSSNYDSNPPSKDTTTTLSSSISEFKKKASMIGLEIHQASQKITRLAKLAKRSSMFNDPLVEIQELTAMIKSDITTLNMAVLNLQALQNMEIADGKCSKDRVDHTTSICDELKSRLMGTTKQLQDVLTTRTENLKAHENRKQIFSTNASRGNPFRNNAKTVTEPPPWLNASNASGILPPEVMPPSLAGGTHLRRRLATDNTPSYLVEASMLQQVVPRHDSFTQSRAGALQNVESTISELGGIFTQLATMVAHQGELAIRIDDNMDESLSNVEGARSALLKNLNKISSNRWLLIKIFGILIFFLMVFIFFVV
ncbi:hypothetical protein GIB67_036799 [Kingdonia uniflora]|uniref:t-SNARE coiled-coil homology domain-containing protein n=1 Tax=Kingdonia uniflora TaxID=39325 RepID=A0A7J7LX27_9MAGN|nr:hypothetical protein GIB67_036799 [Kingdonia uniflora]